MNEVTVEFNGGGAGVFKRLLSSGFRKEVLDEAAHGMTVEARAHFARREAEPRDNSGFPRFGQTWPKSNFWKGTRGKSVAEKIGKPVVDPGAGTAAVAIDSPALAHKANPNPPPIRPGGGRKYLAIPANPLTAAWDGRPRDFPVQGGEMKFGYAQTPDGKTMPALVASDNYFRRVARGKGKWKDKVVEKDSKQRATRGAGDVLFWLVAKAQVKHDPDALPPKESLGEAAHKAAGGVFARLVGSG